ncbi:MAG TPA: peptidylprolyl isomerase, partial [Minicystis sp.]|nr:peptidylprolyl isomerase [Minicystis sp.]
AAGPTDAGATTVASAQPEDPGSPIDTPLGSATDAGTTLLTGEAPPPLPADAPKSVTFGVILVQYRGAQGAPPNARSRDAALELAKQIAADAKQDFKAAVAKGDKGSAENMGKMTRGFLEPAPEYVLFSLKKDDVSDPVDTPRGFWIVKRIE